jgi:outer membrane protein OmpA-like peptidoglycan-associated protein
MRGTIAFGLLSSILVTAAGCSPPLPPKELVQARTAYASAEKGPATQQAPAELHVAKLALEQAERAFSEDSDSAETKDYAYVAARKAELADASARTLIAQKEKDQAEKEASQLTAEQLKNTRRDLSSTKNELASEKAAREAAEKKAAMALADLKRLAEVKQDTRGTVITLSGGVLFASDQATLLPSAVLKLNEVGDALIKGNPDANITVEGHTDSQGQRQYNMDLSKKRADAVRDQLVTRGVAPDRIKSLGYGPDKPLIDNKTAENRANNRRVEIVVEPTKPH